MNRICFQSQIENRSPNNECPISTHRRVNFGRPQFLEWLESQQQDNQQNILRIRC